MGTTSFIRRRLKKDNRLVLPKSTGAHYSYKRYLSETEGSVIDDVWTDINFVNPMASDNTGYATQKPEALLERIIKEGYIKTTVG